MYKNFTDIHSYFVNIGLTTAVGYLPFKLKISALIE
jgi:hypothetical protein